MSRHYQLKELLKALVKNKVKPKPTQTSTSSIEAHKTASGQSRGFEFDPVQASAFEQDAVVKRWV